MPLAPPNPKVRRFGYTLLVLAALALIGTVTGLDTHGSSAERGLLGVVGVALLLVGIPLTRITTPGVARIVVSPAGLTVAVDGGPVTDLPWRSIETVRLRRIRGRGGGDDGHILAVRLADAADAPPDLRPFEVQGDHRGAELLIGLTRAQGLALRSELPDVAGDRFRRR